MNTFPEAPETIEAQMEWLRQGKRTALLLTPGCMLPELPEGFSSIIVREGLVIFLPSRLSATQVVQASRNGTLGDLLGYGIATKPDPVTPAPGGGDWHEGGPSTHERPVVVVRAPDGTEKQSVVSDSERLEQVKDFAHALADPGDTVEVEDGARVLEDRLQSMAERELKIRPYDAERDGRALAAAARADRHAPLYPTHVIERGGEIVGCVAINSLPLFRIWFHTEKVKAADSRQLLFTIESHYRMAGVPLVATLVPVESPFYPVSARFGYSEAPNLKLFLKGL